MQFEGLIINQRNLINLYNSLGISEDDKLMIFFLVFLEKQGPVVQSIVSLTSSLRVISLTVLADSIYNILICFAEKM